MATKQIKLSISVDQEVRDAYEFLHKHDINVSALIRRAVKAKVEELKVQASKEAVSK